MRAILIGAGAAGLATATVLAQELGNGNALGFKPGISMGGLLGIFATWIGVTIAYMQLRRSIHADNEKRSREIANEVAEIVLKEHKKELDRRFTSFMDRKEQEALNRGFERDISNTQQVCSAISGLASAIKDLTNRQ